MKATMLSTECVNDWCDECRVAACTCDHHRGPTPPPAAEPRRRQPRVSPSREKVFAAIVAYHRRHGAAPTIRDLSRTVGLALGTVHYHVRRLEADGRIAFPTGRVCTIALGPADV